MGDERVFVTGATGFIGASVLRAAMAAGYGVDALTRSEASAAALRAQGVNAVIGDLGDASGSWRTAARRADAIVHLAQPQTFDGRVTTARAKLYGDDRLAMDRTLFKAVGSSTSPERATTANADAPYAMKTPFHTQRALVLTWRRLSKPCRATSRGVCPSLRPSPAGYTAPARGSRSTSLSP